MPEGMDDVDRTFFKLKLATAALILSVIGATSVMADVAVPASSWNGSYAFTDGTGNFASGTSVNWAITQNTSTGEYTYAYSFFDNGHAVSPSHFILEVSSSFTSDNLISANGSTEGPRWWGPGYPGAAGNPNPRGFPRGME